MLKWPGSQGPSCYWDSRALCCSLAPSLPSTMIRPSFRLHSRGRKGCCLWHMLSDGTRSFPHPWPREIELWCPLWPRAPLLALTLWHCFITLTAATGDSPGEVCLVSLRALGLWGAPYTWTWSTIFEYWPPLAGTWILAVPSMPSCFGAGPIHSIIQN